MNAIPQKNKYLDPKNDLTFRKIFGEHPHIIKSFLNAVLPLEPEQQIESVEYLEPEL
ncbi:MAG: PD-(D/E)XK nuclease family transposase, partial [Bacteroidota bacterium]